AAQLTKAGERAVQLAAYEEAGTLLQRAHEMLAGAAHIEQRIGVEMLLANVQSIRGHYSKAVEIMKPALAEARTTGNVRLVANLLGQLGRVAMWMGDEAGSVQYIG